MKRFDISKILFCTVLAIVVVGGAFYYGLHSGTVKNSTYQMVTSLKDNIFSSSELVVEESSTLTKTHPDHFLQPARYKGNGVTINKTDPNHKDLIFLSGFFENGNQLRLIERDGAVVAKWPVKFYDIFKSVKHIRERPATNWNVDIHGALALPDGAVVFNFERCGLVKLDRCGKVVWKVERETHHSVERAEKGGFWTLSRRHYDKDSDMRFPPFYPPCIEDTILRVSEEGKILEEISVPEIFYKNGLEAILTASGSWFDYGVGWDREIIHLNKVTELSSELAADFPMFKTGDLLISIRESNLLMVFDPATRKVKWWRIGPWIRQHDPEFNRGGTISVFNNNCYRIAFGHSGTDKSPLDAPRVSNILQFNPVTDEYKILFGQKPGQELLSIIRGKQDMTATQGLFITEFEGGRVLETDKSGNVIWEFINRYDEDEVAEITEARIYPKNYFKVADWNDCKKGN